MRRRQLLLASAAVAAPPLLTSRTALAAASSEPLQVGFVYSGPIADTGWTYQHDRGRNRCTQEKEGLSFQFHVPESFPGA